MYHFNTIENNSQSLQDVFTFLKNNSRHNLQKLQPGINKIVEATENLYLFLGEKLQVYYKVANEVTSLGSDAAQKISDEVIKDSIESLLKLQAEVTSNLSIFKSSIKNSHLTLNSILNNLDTIKYDINGFRRLVKHLRMLSVSTKIENARLTSKEVDFNVLADNVEKLSSIIGDKINIINQKADVVNKIINSTILNLIKYDKIQQGQQCNILSNFNESINLLKDKYSFGSRTAKLISTDSNEIYNNIASSVESIQMHDISRQQMEHIAQAINEIIILIDNLDSNNEELLKNNISKINNVIKVQHAQLSHSSNEIFGSLGNVNDLLSKMINIVEKISNESNSLLQSFLGTHDDSFIRINQDLEKLFTILDINKQLGIEFENSIQLLNTTINDLSSLLLEIEDIGTEIELIAINARVKASQAGSEGVALDVLAESIQRLSFDAKLQTSLVNKSLTKIMENSSQFASNETYNFEGMNKIILEIKEILFSFNEIDKSSSETASQINNQIHFLKNDFKSCSCYSRFEILKSLNSDVEEYLIDFDSIIKATSSFSNKAFDTELLRNLKNNYTMKSERNIHNKILQTNTKSKVIIEEDDLGSNVELF